MSDDVCADLVSRLKNDVDAASIRDLLALGKDSIYETRDVLAVGLEEAEARRRQDKRLDRALFLVLQDAGESRERNTDIYAQTIVARIIDRLSGYHNIREVRKALLSYLREPYFATLDGGEVVIGLEYIGRTGHQYYLASEVDFEAITFRVHVDHPED